MSRISLVRACLGGCWLLQALHAFAGQPPPEPCPRPAAGARVPEPEDLRSIDGVLRVDLSLQNYRAPEGSERYCYLTSDGHEAPTLRVHPGDRVILRLTNHLAALDADASAAHAMHRHAGATSGTDPCSSGAMTATSTNLHFHGMTMPPVCHQDEVLNTSIQPQDSPFEYRFTVPENEPPGLNWYHPHIHGFTSRQVTGGASGAMIVEGGGGVT
jgi:FtsP/CotA-like multicopper oxidase with cupredoxin domain